MKLLTLNPKRIALTFSLLAALLAAIPGWTQVYNGVALQRQTGNWTKAIPGATVLVCTSAATGNPCAPTATVYTDRTLGTPVVGSTYTADADGNYTIYAQPGVYFTCVTGAGTSNCGYIGVGQASSSVSVLLKTNGTNNGSQATLNLKNGNNITITDDGVGGITFAGPTTGNFLLSTTAHWWTVGGGSNVNFTGAIGMQIGTGAATVKVGPSATEPPGVQIPTGAGAGTSQSINESLPGSDITLGIFNQYSTRVLLNSTATIRVWFGFASAIAGFASNTPGTQFVGFRYSSTVPDTNYQAVVNNGVGQTVSNTGIAPSTTTGQVLGMTKNASGDLVFTINGATVATILHTDPNFPATSTGLQPMLWVDNVGLANNRAYTTNGMYWDTVP